MDGYTPLVPSPVARTNATSTVMVLCLLVAVIGAVAWLSWHDDATRWEHAVEVEATVTDPESCQVSRRSPVTKTCPAEWTVDGNTVEGRITNAYGGHLPLTGRSATGRVISDDPPTVAVEFSGLTRWWGEYAVPLTIGGVVAAALLGLLRRRVANRRDDDRHPTVHG